MAVHKQFFLPCSSDVVVHTAFTACPKRFILCKLGISNGLISQVAIYFHYGQSGSKTKDFCFRIFFSDKLKIFCLMAFATPLFRNSGATIRPELATYSPCPGFDITKANPMPSVVSAITALPSSIFSDMYSGDAWQYRFPGLWQMIPFHP